MPVFGAEPIYQLAQIFVAGIGFSDGLHIPPCSFVVPVAGPDAGAHGRPVWRGYAAGAATRHIEFTGTLAGNRRPLRSGWTCDLSLLAQPLHQSMPLNHNSFPSRIIQIAFAPESVHEMRNDFAGSAYVL
jgi:hypothetical protein